ncbi:MAG TPA: LPXTG cell wall anchor domain-containing protein [Candidatus Limosilactobacillus excrementigallinarum]|nr:LPXTG cell wall anchor domain-containing protein [Candidatus Limosilactobacillus excrementigallinarum]
MKYSKWQGYSLCVSVISGAVIICSGNPIQAAENTSQPPTTSATVALPQTKRIIEITSTDGTVHQQQTDLVSWRSGKYGEYLRTSSAKLPQIAGYQNNANGLVIDKLEKINIPVTVYHIEYFPKDDQQRQPPANCTVDLKDSQGKVYVRHLYTVPYDKTRQVTLQAPTGMVFINSASNDQLLVGKYGEHKEILIQPKELLSKPTTGTAPKTVEPIEETPTPSQKKPQSAKPVKLPSSNHLVSVKDTLILPKKELPVKVTQPVVHHQISQSPNHSITSEMKPVMQLADEKPVTSDLARLKEYNRPLKSHLNHKKLQSTSETLPQTGNRGGQLLVAIGVALLSILGLFHTQHKR